MVKWELIFLEFVPVIASAILFRAPSFDEYRTQVRWAGMAFNLMSIYKSIGMFIYIIVYATKINDSNYLQGNWLKGTFFEPEGIASGGLLYAVGIILLIVIIVIELSSLILSISIIYLTRMMSHFNILVYPIKDVSERKRVYESHPEGQEHKRILAQSGLEDRMSHIEDP